MVAYSAPPSEVPIFDPSANTTISGMSNCPSSASPKHQNLLLRFAAQSKPDCCMCLLKRGIIPLGHGLASHRPPRFPPTGPGHTHASLPQAQDRSQFEYGAVDGILVAFLDFSAWVNCGGEIVN